MPSEKFSPIESAVPTLETITQKVRVSVTSECFAKLPASDDPRRWVRIQSPLRSLKHLVVIADQIARMLPNRRPSSTPRHVANVSADCRIDRSPLPQASDLHAVSRQKLFGALNFQEHVESDIVRIRLADAGENVPDELRNARSGPDLMSVTLSGRHLIRS